MLISGLSSVSACSSALQPPWTKPVYDIALRASSLSPALHFESFAHSAAQNLHTADQPTLVPDKPAPDQCEMHMSQYFIESFPFLDIYTGGKRRVLESKLGRQGSTESIKHGISTTSVSSTRHPVDPQQNFDPSLPSKSSFRKPEGPSPATGCSRLA